MKIKLVVAALHRGAGEERGIGAANGVQCRRRQLVARAIGVDPGQTDAHSGSRPAMRGVEHVGGQFAHLQTVRPNSAASRSRVIAKISPSAVSISIARELPRRVSKAARRLLLS